MTRSNTNIPLTRHREIHPSTNHDLKDRIELYMRVESSKVHVTNVERLDIELLIVVLVEEETKIKINDHLQQQLPQGLLTKEEVEIFLIQEEVETVLDSQERVLVVRKLVTEKLSVFKFAINVMLLMQL
jgi:predicted RNA-binding protein associated with RNAse of E/G family